METGAMGRKATGVEPADSSGGRKKKQTAPLERLLTMDQGRQTRTVARWSLDARYFWGQRNSLLSIQIIQEKTSHCQPENTLPQHIFRQKSTKNIPFFGPIRKSCQLREKLHELPLTSPSRVRQ
jgi:hypothetical protein